jgi:hypothetical protein
MDGAERKRYRKLARMSGLLDVVCLDVWNIPNVRRILAQRIPAEFAFLVPFIVLFSRLFLRDTNRVQIESIVLSFGKPK